jgi:transposase
MIMDDLGKQFRFWNPLEGRREIFSPEESLPEEDLVFFLLELISTLDLSAFYSFYSTDPRGQPPFSVPMMTTLLVYSYSVGVFSSRKIALACDRNLAFMAIVGNQRPDFRTISEFRKNHQAAMKPLFLEVLRIAGEMQLVSLGNLSTDGTKVRANASRHKAMSYGYMEKEVTRLEAEIDELLANAGRTDAEQDAALGSRRGDELPAELKRREDRLAKIQAAKARLEAEARARAEAEQATRDAAEAQRQAEGRKRHGREPAPVDPTPAPKAQTNFTDPEAKIMKTSNKGFDYCYNGQAIVDSKNQIIVAAELTNAANDKQQAVPLAAAALENLSAAGIALPRNDEGELQLIPNTADSGYFSESNVTELESLGFDPHIATGRQKHNTPRADSAASTPSDSPQEPAQPTPKVATLKEPTPKEATAKEAMAAKLRTDAGRKLYAARKHIVEPVFGQMKHVRGFRQLLRRGLERASAEWQLICLTHNLLKIWRHQMSPV